VLAFITASARRIRTSGGARETGDRHRWLPYRLDRRASRRSSRFETYTDRRMIGPTPYVAVQQMLDNAAPKGIRNYWTADSIAELTDDASTYSSTTRRIRCRRSPRSSSLPVRRNCEVADERRRFGQRNAPWTVHYASMWADSADDQINIAYTKELAASMKRGPRARVYLNFIGNEGSGRVAASFGPEKYQRLTELKRKWDPTNLFRHNQIFAGA